MITQLSGDLLHSGCDIICHQVNCQGVMGSGIARQIRDKFPGLFEAYERVVDTNGGEECLGQVFFYPTTFCTVANMFSQFHYLPRDVMNTNYSAFRQCCKGIKDYVYATCGPGSKYCRIGFPHGIGCGLAGGDWNIISQILEEEFDGSDWNVEIWKFDTRD